MKNSHLNKWQDKRIDRFSAFAALFITKTETYNFFFKQNSRLQDSSLGLIHLKYK